MRGQSESGDLFTVAPTPGGAMVAVVDGVGHGGEAALSSRTAIATLERHAVEHPISLVQRCHAALRSSRGVVLSIASFHAREGLLTWIGVGNVEGILLPADPDSPCMSLLLRNGVLGVQLPSLQAAVLPVLKGDVLILATDGIRPGFGDGIARTDPPQRIAEAVLRRHARGTDDACVLAVRFGGSP
ncbi:MAG TPA: SpoIIE family protein phosphatase [Planctomycetota bacterium]|nr:SpoIIE family protein phosphatase [Planctomycetota bacterium]